MTAGVQATATRGGAGTPAGVLGGERVAFTGRLASMNRREAAELVVRGGGRMHAAVSPRVTMLVVGTRGWPLLEDGRVTRKLAVAEGLRSGGAAIRILSERDFRELVGLDPAPADAAKPLGADQVIAALGIEPATLQRLQQLDLVRPRDGRFDFRDLVSLRTVIDLMSRGVSPALIRRSLEGLAGVLPGVDRPLAQLKILAEGPGRLVAELEHAFLAPGGQLEFRFDGRPGPLPASGEAMPIGTDATTQDTTDWMAVGVELEDDGRLEEAERAYRRAVERDPSDAAAQFNLGNALLAQDRPEGAAERFAQAAALDPTYTQAWYNLSHAQDALGRRVAAVESLRRVITLQPAHTDARFNIADLLERLGRHAEAASAWKDYLRLDAVSEWAAEARRRLSG